jgi:adenylate cyclase
MALINPQTPARNSAFQFGFKTSIIALFVSIVLVIGLTLVYLSFSRINAITGAAASQFLGKVAELSADRIGSQLKLVRDNLAVLNALPSVQAGEIEDNPRLNALLAAMLKNNGQLFNLYVGYADGSFIEMDAIDGTGRETRARLEAPDQASFRLVVISRSDPARVKSTRRFLSATLETIRELPGPLDYDPRERPWYKDADRRDGSGLTGPYVFFATAKQGYTVQLALEQGKGGVVAGDLLLDVTQELLKKESLTPSGVAFLFDDEDRILVGAARTRGPGHHSSAARNRYGRRARGDTRLARRWNPATVLLRFRGPAVRRRLRDDTSFRGGQSPPRRRGAGR